MHQKVLWRNQILFSDRFLPVSQATRPLIRNPKASPTQK